MNKSLAHLIVTGFTVGSLLTACGGGGGSSGEETAPVSFGLSDAPIGDLDSVTITVDRMIFSREGQPPITLETFTSQSMGLEDADTFTIDLLDVQGNNYRIAVDSVDLPVGEYTSLELDILDEDISYSYVDEANTSLRKELKVPSDTLRLGRFTVNSGNLQTFVVEFDLSHAMTYNPGPDRYILKPRGVRIVRLDEATSVSGTVDISALNSQMPCIGKTLITENNNVYLYRGHDLNPSALVDQFDSSIEPNIPSGAIAPYAFANLDASGNYFFSFLEAGNYTLAFTCQGGLDDPDVIDNFVIPSPSNQLIELTLGEGNDIVCNGPASSGTCQP